MGTGTSSGKTVTMTDIVKANKAVTVAKQQVGKARKAFKSADAAYSVFKNHGGYEKKEAAQGKAAADNELAQREAARNQAEASLQIRENKLNEAQSNLDKLSKQYQKQGKTKAKTSAEEIPF